MSVAPGEPCDLLTIVPRRRDDDTAAASRSEGDREAQASALSLYALFVDAQWEQSTGTGFEGREAHAVAVERLHARALRADPTHAVALGRYARFAWQTRLDKTLAAALFERALKNVPDDPRNLAWYGELLYERSDLAGASACFVRGLKSCPGHRRLSRGYERLLRENPTMKRARGTIASAGVHQAAPRPTARELADSFDDEDEARFNEIMEAELAAILSSELGSDGGVG